jgi:hypothetical protein
MTWLIEYHTHDNAALSRQIDARHVSDEDLVHIPRIELQFDLKGLGRPYAITLFKHSANATGLHPNDQEWFTNLSHDCLAHLEVCDILRSRWYSAMQSLDLTEEDFAPNRFLRLQLGCMLSIAEDVDVELLKLDLSDETFEGFPGTDFDETDWD